MVPSRIDLSRLLAIGVPVNAGICHPIPGNPVAIAVAKLAGKHRRQGARYRFQVRGADLNVLPEAPLAASKRLTPYRCWATGQAMKLARTGDRARRLFR